MVNMSVPVISPGVNVVESIGKPWTVSGGGYYYGLNQQAGANATTPIPSDGGTFPDPAINTEDLSGGKKRRKTRKNKKSKKRRHKKKRSKKLKKRRTNKKLYKKKRRKTRRKIYRGGDSRNRFFQPLSDLYRHAQFTGQDLINQYEGKTPPLNPAPYVQNPTPNTDVSTVPSIPDLENTYDAANQAVSNI